MNDEERTAKVLSALAGPLRGSDYDPCWEFWKTQRKNDGLGFGVEDQLLACCCARKGGCPDLYRCKVKEWREG